MSCCSGKTECEIYRDKKYCRKLDEKNGLNNVCNCRHAVRRCKVGNCIFDEFCKVKDEPSLEDLIAEKRRANNG